MIRTVHDRLIQHDFETNYNTGCVITNLKIGNIVTLTKPYTSRIRPCTINAWTNPHITVGDPTVVPIATCENTPSEAITP